MSSSAPHAGPLFIIGCARSGTTWLGRIFAASSGFRVTIEDPIIFPLVDEAVLFWRSGDAVFNRLTTLYREHIARAGADVYVDKSHQNIWLVERLSRAFPSARYIAIERCAYGTIASMLRHPAVLRHYLIWRDYHVPNAHLGITAAQASTYERLALDEKCALRWRSHHDRLLVLRTMLLERLHVVSYDDLITQPQAETERLERFVGRPLRIESPRVESLTKWRDVLGGSQLARIDQVLSRARPEIAS